MRALQEVGKLSGGAMAGLRGIETLKAAALELDFFARWAGHYARAAKAQQALQNLAHYHTERNHQGLGNQRITPESERSHQGGVVVRRDRLGGLLSYYYRDAA
jgi:hypothetical protein